MKNKRGDILVGDVIFLVLNLIFLSILILFVVTKTNDAATIEEKYAKQIALVIDSAEPAMRININMEDAIEKAVNNNPDIEAGLLQMVQINGNVVTVKLEEKGGHSYSFFNDVNASAYLDNSNGKEYVLIINEKTTAK